MSWFLLDLAWKSALILGLAYLLVAFLRGAAAATRHLVWALAMGALLFLPVLALVLPSRELAILPSAASLPEQQGSIGGFDPVSAGPPAENSIRSGSLELKPPPRDTVAILGRQSSPTLLARAPQAVQGSVRGPIAARPSDGTPPSPAGTSSLWPWILTTWMLGVGLVLAPMLVGLVLTRRRRSDRERWDEDQVQACADRLGIDPSSIQVITADRIAFPMLSGLWRPTLWMPEAARDWPESQQCSVLLHELAHLGRRDHLTQCMARISLALFWFNPLAWHAARRMRAERERAADDLVLLAGVPPKDYVRTLLDLARGDRFTLSASTLRVAGPSEFEGRLLAILDSTLRRGRVAGRSMMFSALGALIAVAALASTHPTTAQAQTPDQSIASSQVVELRVAGPGSPSAAEADYTSIQAAIDAAPEGARIQIAAGLFEETLSISKGLTLLGAPNLGTRVVGSESSGLVIDIRAGASVVLEGLRITGSGEHRDGAILGGACLQIDDAAVTVRRCLIAGGPASGVVIDGQSAVAVEDSFVGGLWSEGIVVKGTASLRVSRCDLRNIHHYGVLIRSTGEVLVEDSRISGTGWHGIRYDDASPTIRGNLIFENERTGIYANGKTKAQIIQNHIARNGMVGVSCWGSNGDVIRGNTFSDNQRSAIEILGDSNPHIESNLFFRNPVAVANGNVKGESPFTHHLDQVTFRNNGFWKNEHNLVLRTGAGAVPQAVHDELWGRGNEEFDPGFLDAKASDARLAPDSAARQRGIGAPAPPLVESPWPTQPEEQPFLTSRQRKAVLATAPSLQEAWKMAQPWISDTLQIDDPELRVRTVEIIRKAIASPDEGTRLAGLMAFLGSAEAKFDKASFRPVILPCTGSAHGVVQSRAFYALNLAGRQPTDLKLLLAEARKNRPGLDESISHLILMYTEGRIEGDAAALLLERFQSSDRDQLRELCRGLWGARVSPELEARLLELYATEDPDLRHDVLYFALSTLADKSKPVLAALFQAVQSPRRENSSRALWGLSHGVPAESQSEVADFALRLFKARDAGRSRSEAMSLLRLYAGKTQAQELATLAEDEQLDDDSRAQLRTILEQIH